MDHRLFGIWSLLGHRRWEAGRLQGVWRICRGWWNGYRLRRRRLRVEFVRQRATAAELLPTVCEKEHGVQAEWPLDDTTILETRIRRVGSHNAELTHKPAASIWETLEVPEFQSFQMSL